MHVSKQRSFSFGRTAWFYDFLARLVFGGAIRRSQTALLPFIPAQARVLIVGGGTGWLLEDLARRTGNLKIVYLELSSRMLARAQKKLGHLPSHLLVVEFRQGTETDLKPEEIFDVIFTPFVLDLYSEMELQTMLKNLQQHLSPGGLWLLTDFFIAPHLTGWQKYWRHRLAQTMYLFFGWLIGLPTRTLPNLELLLQKLALKHINTQPFYFGFIQARVYQHMVLKKESA